MVPRLGSVSALAGRFNFDGHYLRRGPGFLGPPPKPTPRHTAGSGWRSGLGLGLFLAGQGGLGRSGGP